MREAIQEQNHSVTRVHVVAIGMDVIQLDEVTRQIVRDASAGRQGYVCAANVHMTMEAHDDPAFARIVAAARYVLPDGMPLVWAQRVLGFKHARRVRGPDLTLSVALEAARLGLPVGIFGSTCETAAGFQTALEQHAPGLNVVANLSPPFGPAINAPEFIGKLRDSGARIVFVGLGCPKQERWMAQHTDALKAVLLGVGAAFDFHAGTVPEAPRWLGNLGLEWAFRLASDPRRLWRRYLRHNPRFVVALAAQLLGLGPAGARRTKGTENG